MIPAQITKTLLQSLLKNLLTGHNQPDYARFRAPDLVAELYGDFFCVLHHSEDDLSFVNELIEKDPDCHTINPVVQLQALVDYVEITLAIYSEVELGSSQISVH
ncbi:hypothetical protein [Terasakiella pusilla]|uniref:hypothetical protein n=1 Tax=Terasakiella pusilla TaxID=64973 RepID=UPI003AA9734E